ncbi:MAG: 7-carboxy-7-deazaguanine synthase QueE [Candidatus Omnitrophica bacterium]|nr:7-carboxy-7-deazaguanine synthase QueE [Candidatus Omnitrophota bacterium]
MKPVLKIRSNHKLLMIKKRKIKRTAEKHADLVEIFSSIQGEGLLVGAKQIFIRFAGCNLGCIFCDTPKDARITGISVDEILKKVKYVDRIYGEHHSVSLTGGEPLLHVSFLKKLLPVLKDEGFKIYLETNGTLYRELKQVIKHIDIIAMDFKLPSSAAMAPLWRSHREFLKIALKRNVFIKAVVTDKTQLADIIEARNLIAKFNKDMILILQPATPIGNRDKVVSANRLNNYRNISAERLVNVRVIPQMHKMMGIK